MGLRHCRVEVRGLRIITYVQNLAYGFAASASSAKVGEGKKKLPELKDFAG